MKDSLLKRKVIVRHLPPNITLPDLLSQIDVRFADRYSLFAFRPGKSSHKNQKYSRAYIDFKAQEDVYEFAAFFNGHVFVNEKGAQCKAVVEYAPSQRVPNPCAKKDPREGAIYKDPDYLEFLKIMAKPVENLPSAEIQLERKEAKQSGTANNTPIITPLMEFIRLKRASEIGTQGIRKSSRRGRTESANKLSSRTSKRRSEKKKDNAKNMTRKSKSAYVVSSKQDDQRLTSSGKEQPENETVSVIDSSLPGIALTMNSGKKKFLLLKAKDRDNLVQIETTSMGSLTASKQYQKNDAGGRLIKDMLPKYEQRQKMQSSGKEDHGSGSLGEKQEKRTRNKERPDRVAWAPLPRSEGSNISEDRTSSSTGSGRHSVRRAGARSRKDDSVVLIVDGRSSRRGGNSSSLNEKQMWVQKSSSGL